MHLFSRKIQAPNAKRKYLAHDSLPHKKTGMDSLDPAYVSKKGCLFQDTTVATCSLGFLTGGAVNLAAEGGGTLVGSTPGCQDAQWRWKNVLHNPRDSYWTHHLATLRHFFRGGFSRSRLKKPSHLLHGNLRVATHPWKIRPYFLSEIGGIRGYVPKFPWHGSPVVYCWNLLMEAILHHVGCIEPCKSWDKLPTSTGSLDFWTINSITNQKNTSELMCI